MHSRIEIIINYNFVKSFKSLLIAYYTNLVIFLNILQAREWDTSKV